MPLLKRFSKPTSNFDGYNKPSVASHFSSIEYITPCEQLLFDEYLKPGATILDLGVGGGRLTPYLSAVGESYVGGDYAPEMIAACRKKFPNLKFEVVDASDLSMFGAASFDAVVMAFNTIDYIIPNESRHRALTELRRVLKPNGTLIFSSHNMLSVFPRPAGWNRDRARSVAEAMVGSDSFLYRPLVWGLTGARTALAVFRALGESARRAFRAAVNRSFWVGQGYLRAEVYREMLVYHSTPKTTEAELNRFGFRLLRVLGDDYPKRSHRFVTDWYYYVFASDG